MNNEVNMKQTLTLIIILSCAALLLAACGGNIAEAKDTTLIRLTVEGTDTFEFTPNEATIPAKSTVSFTFKNAGNLDHNFIIAADEIDPFRLSETDALEEINTGVVSGGEEAKLAFQAPASGTYTFVCVIPGHAAAGMTGTLIVAEP